jgi:hypothetical protein
MRSFSTPIRYRPSLVPSVARAGVADGMEGGVQHQRQHHGRVAVRGSGSFEPFRERRARALALPAAYASEFAQYVSDVIDVDVGARYFSFAFWTKAPWGRDSVQVSRMIQRACQYASCDECPTLSRSALNRIPLHWALAAILVPAQKQHGVLHVHGFLRVPVAAVNAGITVMSVQTNGTRIRVSAPRAVERFATYLRKFAGGSATSLHVDHEAI